MNLFQASKKIERGEFGKNTLLKDINTEYSIRKTVIDVS